MRAAILVLALAAIGCGRNVQPWEYSPRPMADTLAIWEPEERDVPIVYDAAHSFFIRPIGGLFMPGGGPALNADPMDEVVNSTWFTNRNPVAPLTPDQVMRGPHTIDGPDDSGPIIIKDDKSEGVNVGFFIEDASENRYLVKLDPPDWPGMASGADVLATNLVWAAGYHTPENYIYDFDPNNIEIDEDFEVQTVEEGMIVNYVVGAEDDDERELTPDVFRRLLLERYPRQADGTIRALASKFVPGTPRGPFDWIWWRMDDDNDVIPHQDRRELRGYYVVAAWLNQTDTKQGNTLDAFVIDEDSPEDEEAGRRFGHLVHYMLDNGAALGSGGPRPHTPRKGSENDLDLNAIGKRFLTFSIYERPWQDVPEEDDIEMIGWYEADIFDPGDWRPNMPNPAFDRVDARDGYWGAKIVMSFTDLQLERAVEATQWSDAQAKAYILRGLKERRDKTGRYWFARVSPLDDPRVENGTVVFDDLWIRHFGGPAEYRWRFRWDAFRPRLRAEGTVSQARIPLPAPPGPPPAELDPEDRYARLEVWKRKADGDWAPRPAIFWLAWQGGSYQVIGARY